MADKALRKSAAELAARIDGLVSSNPGQLREDEYLAVAEEVIARGRHSSFLVFGCGNDSPFWLSLSPGAVFLEHDKRWAAKTKEACPAASIVPVRYTTTLSEARLIIADPSRLEMALPDAVRAMRWDVIFVDSPPGYGTQPGRMQAIYEASRLAAPDACVFVHDVHRDVEDLYSRTFLGPQAARVRNLGVYGSRAKR